MDTLQLDDYSIVIGDFWEALNQLIQESNYSKIAVLVDSNTFVHCLPILRQKLELNGLHFLEIPAGEQHKNLATCQQIWSDLLQLEFDRKALLLNLGGGVIGDMGGFCASTYKRGIDFIQIPTTLLSQVDASIGGKLGIDLDQVKNSVGLFHNPQGVFIDPSFLKTLSFREVRSGLAEIIKHSLIANAEQWEQLQDLGDLESVRWEPIIVNSLQIKQAIVAEDPFEKGLRKALNFGHTIGHAVESWALSSEHPLLHGEAIAIGMICETYLSHKVLEMPADSLQAVVKFLLQTYGHYSIPKEADEALLSYMRKDKKNEQAAINFTLLKEIGEAAINHTASDHLILKSLQFYRDLNV